MYSLTVLLTDQCPLTLEALLGRVKETFASDPETTVVLGVAPDENAEYGWEWYIRVQVDAWNIWVAEMKRPLEPEECAAILKQAGHHPKHLEIEACTRWLQVSAGDDYDLIYFTDYMFLTADIESFDGVYLYDEESEVFLDQLCGETQSTQETSVTHG